MNIFPIGVDNECIMNQLVRRVDYSLRACVATVMGLLFCCQKRDEKEPK
jgi:hypothetical protein